MSRFATLDGVPIPARVIEVREAIAAAQADWRHSALELPGLTRETEAYLLECARDYARRKYGVRFRFIRDDEYSGVAH